MFVRSEMAHARLLSIDISEALAMPGVVAVLTGEDLAVKPQHGMARVHEDFAKPPLAVGKVRYVGEAVAAIVAESVTEGRGPRPIW